METILAAIVGALAKLAEPAIKDAYDALKSLIRRKAGRESPLSHSIDNLEAKAESKGRQQTLGEEIEASGIGGDPEVLQLAQRLVASLQGAQCTTQVIQNVHGNENIFSGTGNVTVKR